MSNDSNNKDPMEFLKSMWGHMGFSLPGMVTPTLDVDELGKRIADLKAVEGWLKMNLNTLQMSIQGLEMQRVALATAQAMGQAMSQGAQAHSEAGTASATSVNIPTAAAAADSAAQFQQALMNAALNPALWPWNFMQPGAAAEPTPPTPASTEKPSRTSASPRRKNAK